MTNNRIMVVEHPRESAHLYLAENKIQGAVPIHHLMLDYHWQRIDDTHVLLRGNYSISNSVKIAEHKQVTVLPHSSSKKKLKDHCEFSNKHRHWHALASAMSLPDDADMGHLLEAMSEKCGPLLQPSK